MASASYQANVNAAKKYLNETVNDDPRAECTPGLSVQVAQVHALLAIADAICGLQPGSGKES